MKNVISLKDLERMQREGKGLNNLPEGAILTPSARDYLNDLELGGGAKNTAPAPSAAGAPAAKISPPGNQRGE